MIESIIKLLHYYKSLGEKTIDALSDDELHLEPGDDVNSIPIIVKHMSGNMLSRWTNFLTEDGEKEWRNREEEFNATLKNRTEILESWEKGWKCFLDALANLDESDLDKIVFIRNEGHTVMEAIHRQLAHYSYHIGQIVYLGKIIKGEDWVSLSIPKGKSEEFNELKFASEKDRQHFTGA